MFMGTFYNSIDAKNRIIVPSKHRDELGGKCVVTKGIDTCLVIYSIKDWEAQVEKISQLPESDPDVRTFIRHFFGNAQECELDKQGRIVIPQELKQYAKLDKELVTMGAMKKIEIWAKEEWEKPDNEGNMDHESFGVALEKYNF